MECEEFILPDWSPPDDPARPCRPKAGHGLVKIMLMMATMVVLVDLELKGNPALLETGQVFQPHRAL